MQHLFILLLRLYRVSLGPLLALFGAQCRFEPSCSNYSEQAIREHGSIKGVWLTAKRLARCQPFCEGGYDPVPPKKESTDHLQK